MDGEVEHSAFSPAISTRVLMSDKHGGTTATIITTVTSGQGKGHLGKGTRTLYDIF